MNDLLLRLTPHLVNSRISRSTKMSTVYADAANITGLRWTFARFGNEWLVTTLTGNPAADDFEILENLRPATAEELATLPDFPEAV